MAADTLLVMQEDDNTHATYLTAMAETTQSHKDDNTHGTFFTAMTETPESHAPPKGPCDADKNERRRPIRSFVVIYTMIFFNGCCFTAVVPSVPFYLQVLNAPSSFLGWVISFYSVGQMMGSPAGGWLADKVSAKGLLTGSSICGLVSSVIYAVAPTYKWILLARLLTGISAGMEITTELAFIAKNTSTRARTAYLSSVSAVNMLGFFMGPSLAGLLSTWHGGSIFGLEVDEYTGPGWLLAIMFLVDICMVQGIFQDTQNPELVNSDEGTEQREQERPPPAVSLVLGLVFVQSTAMCAFSVLETITSPLVEDHFGWDVQDW